MLSHLDEFRIYADRFDIPEEQKTELVQIVWTIMQNAVDRALRNDPAQYVLDAREKQQAKSALSGPLVLDFKKVTTTHENHDDMGRNAETFRMADDESDQSEDMNE